MTAWHAKRAQRSDPAARAALALVAGLLALLLAACQETQTIGLENVEARDSDRTLLPLEVGQIATITIDAQLGDITVQRGERADRVELAWTRIAYAESDSAADDELDDVVFRFEQAGNAITLDARQPRRDNERTNRVDIELLVPETVRLRIDSATGTVRIDGVTVPDTLRVNLSTGEILAENVAAPDGLLLSTTTGAIRFDGTLGDSGLYTLETTTGSLTVRLPADVAFEVDARTTTGSIQVSGFDLAGADRSGQGVSETLSAVINGGGPALTLRVTTGDIRLDVRE